MASPNQTGFDLFISFAEEDRSWVHGYLLPELGLPQERVCTKERFTPGASLIGEFNRAISGSRYTVLVLTSAYHADEWSVYGGEVSSYVAVAERRDRLIPLRLQPTDLSLDVAFRVSLDCTRPDQWKTEVKRLRDLLGQAEPPTEQIPCPYPGLESFTEENAEFYVGREKEAEAVADRLGRTHAVTIIGPSGSGKSSFLHAGLIPLLKSEASFQPADWSIVKLRPGPQPLDRLGALLAEHLSESVEQVTATLQTDPNSLSGYLAKILDGRPNVRIALVVDQFEEVFTQCKDVSVRDLFLTRLSELFRAGMERVFLIIAVRSDFYGDCQKSVLWPHIEASLINLLPLTPADLHRAIQEPAREVGVFVEPTLVERLVADAKDESGALPLLQETMVSLWKKHLRRRLLAIVDYEAMGSDGRTGLQNALNARAEASLAGLVGPQQRDIARRIFVRLVEFGEQKRFTRRQQPEDSLRAEGDPEQTFDYVLEFLIGQRLLMADRDPKTGGGVIDLAHEALIDAWAQLGVWIESYQVLEEGRRSLVLSAAAWQAKNQDASYLFSGRRLKEAEAWEQKWRSELGGLEIAFLEQSRLHRRRQRYFLVIGSTVGVMALVAILGLWVPQLFEDNRRESVRTQTGTELVELQGGQTIIGIDDPSFEPSERLRMVDLLPFGIEKYEVSIGQYKACVDYGPCESPRIPGILEESSRLDYPIVHVSGGQAETYCNWLERRLPTSVEWERAARGQNGRLWPWGDQPKGCEEFAFGCGIVAVNAGGETATPPPEVIYHLASNVSEWVVLVPNDCQLAVCHGMWDGKTDSIAHRGGASDIPLERITQVIRSSPDSPDESIGFRCVSTPSSVQSTGG